MTTKMKTTVNVLRKQEAVDNGMSIIFDAGQFCRTPMWNPFIFAYGNSAYELDEINFYSDNGVEIKINSGWFGNNNRHDHMGFIKNGKLSDIKRKKEAKFDKPEVYFLSLGKKYSNANRAALYVPMAYLDNMGWEIVEHKTVNEFNTFTTTSLVTPLLKEGQTLSAKSENHFEAVKAELMKAIDAATCRKEVKEAFDKWEWKL